MATSTQWQRTYHAWVSRAQHMIGEERLWSRALCQMLLDAIDGPRGVSEDWDTEGVLEASRTVARSMVDALHDDFVVRCECAGLSPEAVSEAFRAGHIHRSDIERAFRLFEIRKRQPQFGE